MNRAKPKSAGTARRSATLRFAAAALSVAISGWLLKTGRSPNAELAAEVGALDLSGRLARAVASEPVRARAELLTARALVAHELDQSWLLEIPEAERPAALEASLERLARAAELSRAVLAELPSSWQAAMLVGATTHLERRRRRDPRFFTRYREWEAPLELALALGPSQLEPERYLLAAYLDAWRALSPEKKEQTRERLAVAFDDPTTFRTLIQAWLSVSPSIESGLEIVPSRPSSWALLRQLFAAQADWDRYLVCDRRHVEAVQQQAAADLTDEPVETATLGRLLSRLPLDLRSTPQLERALEILPAAAAPAGLGEAANAWLDWAVGRARFADSPLSPAAITRLAELANEHRLQASAAVLTGDLGRAESLERQAYSLHTELWAPYLLLKADRLARGGDAGAAAAALARLSSAWIDSPQAVETRWLLAELNADEAAIAASRRERQRVSTDRWSADAWRPSLRGWRLEVLAVGRAVGLEIEIAALPRRGGAFALLVDGATVARFGLREPGVTELRHELDAGLHLIELVPLSAGQARPGGLRWIG